ncbi:S8 family serine peptidase [Nostoc sp. CHAB 5844]|nr:S8 family serine peptidase [Nostoc sp. CHAB 5844]
MTIIGATVTPSLIHTIAAHPDVKRISLDHKKGSSRLNVSRNVVQANTVNSRGLTGLYETVGIVEEYIMGDHSNLPSAQRTACNLQDLTILDGQILTGVHKNLVAGIIQSTNASYRGITPDINIVDGVVARNYPTTSIMAATECVINNSVGVINMSFFEEETNGDFNEFARYVDKVVYETGVNIVVAASNLCENRPGSPDISFNIINVGSFGDNNTTSFADDIVPCTNGIIGSYLNPNTMHMDREEPDVVAPGVNIKSTNKQGGFEDASGTSYAAPHVTSAVALLIRRKPALYFNPAEVRSVIMASARHNVEGNSRLSDRDGAGGIMLAAADTVVSSGLSDYIINDGSAPNFPISKTFTASSGQKVRVAIAWDHKMPYGERLSVPTSDLDLRVFCGSTLVSSSLSFDNNYEIVEFTAGSCPSGYTAKIIGVSLSVGDEHIGFAYSKTDT